MKRHFSEKLIPAFCLLVILTAFAILAREWRQSTSAARRRAAMLTGHTFVLDRKDVTGDPGYRLLYVSFLSPEGRRASYRLREGTPGFDQLSELSLGQSVRFCAQTGWLGLSARHYTMSYVTVCSL